MLTFSMKLVQLKFFFAIRIVKQHLSNLQQYCANKLPWSLVEKLLFLKCTEPKSTRFKISILHYQITVAFLTISVKWIQFVYAKNDAFF